MFMTMRALLCAAALFGVVSALTPTMSSAQDDTTIGFAADDAEMNAAIEEARATLAAFHDYVAAEPGGDALVKVAIETPSGGNEHIWMMFESVADDGAYLGAIANQGVQIPYGPGDPYRADPSQISDWVFFGQPVDRGPIFGGYTMRVIAARYPDSMRPEFIARFQPVE